MRTSVAETNWSPKANVGVIVLERGFPSRRHKHKILSGDPSVAELVGSCSIGNEYSGGNCPIEDEALKPKDRCLYCDSRVRASLLEIQTN